MVARTPCITGSSGAKLDPRNSPFRLSDYVAGIELEDELKDSPERWTFLTPHLSEVVGFSAALRHEPKKGSERISTLRRGERVKIYDHQNGWAWVKCERDDHVGYIEFSCTLVHELSTPSHRVCVPSVLALAGPDVEYNTLGVLSLGSLVSVEETVGEFVRLAGCGWVREDELTSITSDDTSKEPLDWVALGCDHVNAPYEWGDLDCSGLVQRLLLEAGIWCPRDTDMINAYFGESRALQLPTKRDERRLMRGDIVVWPTHIGVMVNSTDLLHACPWHRRVRIENLDKYEAARREKRRQEIVSIKRLR